LDFQKQSGIVGVDPNSSTFAQQVADLNKEFTSAQSDRIQLQAYLNRKDSPDTLPQFRNHPVSTFITQRIADVSSELSQQKVIYGENNPNVKKLERQLQELQSQLERQEKATVDELKTNYAAAKARETLMSNQKRETAKGLSDMAEFMSLKKEADVDAELYNNLYSRAKESAMAAASRSSSIRVVDPARSLDQPTRPKPLLNLAIGLLLSMVGGVAVAFAREQLDKNTVRTPQDMKNCLGSGTVSIVPAFAEANGHKKKFLTGRAPFAFLGAGAGDTRPQKFMMERPTSPESEALRHLYTSIMLSRPERPFQVLQIASSFAGEGKTTLAVNLAITLAQHGKTCLVDADVRRGRIASVFGLEPQHGIEVVLSGAVPASEALQKVPDIPNLQVLPAGATHAALKLNAWIQPLRNLIYELRENFEFVIIDSPPVLTHADARAISTAADGIVFVSRFGTTTHQAIVRSMELLSDVHSAPIIEVVLNAAAFSASEYPYYEYESAA
jgi:capsular exopolysaccharide synthesis family protein